MTSQQFMSFRDVIMWSGKRVLQSVGETFYFKPYTGNPTPTPALKKEISKFNHTKLKRQQGKNKIKR